MSLKITNSSSVGIETKTLQTKNIKTKNLFVKNNTLIKNNAVVENTLQVGKEYLLSSKNITSDLGFTIGRNPTKDMENENYTNEFNPFNYQSSFFPGMADFINSNIVAGDKSSGSRLTASYWNDLGNDVFDDWGYFYLYDVNSGKYYFPLIYPQNQDNGIITTQTFTAFERTFTISHGWTVQGIFKVDISVNDNKLFRFGAYGNMGSDGDEELEELTESYTVKGYDLTLYYHHHQESGDSIEQLYSYFIPKKISENDSIQSYNAYYDSDDMSILSKEVTSGLLVYFSKSYNVKDWIINDIDVSSDSSYSTLINGNEYVKGNILSSGTNLGRLSLTTMSDSNYNASASSLINGYLKNSTLSGNRLFVIPSAEDIVSAIPNCCLNTSFRFTINNVQSGSYNRTLSTYDGSVTIDSSCLNIDVVQNFIFSYIVLITNITSGSESAIILQDSNTELF